MTEVATLGPFIDLILRGGAASAIAFLILGGIKEHYVWGSTHRRIIADKDAQITKLERERDRLIDLAFKGAGIAKDLAQGLADSGGPRT